MSNIHSAKVQEIIERAQDVCINRADMAQYTDDKFITNDYIAVAHMLHHGLQVIDYCLGFEDPMVYRPLWEPYIELACRILGIKIEGFEVDPITE